MSSGIMPIEHRWNCGFSTPAKKGFEVTSSECFERCWHCPSYLGSGTFRRIRIRDGFEIWITDCCMSRDVCFSFHGTPAAFFFGFYLSGKTSMEFARRAASIEFCENQQYVNYINDPNGLGSVKAREPFRHVSIMFNPQRLGSYFEDDPSELPSPLLDVVKDKTEEDFSYAESITPAMYGALRQIVDCPLSGPARKLFLESRALELVAYQLSGILGQALPQDCNCSGPIHPNDRKQIELAKDCLLRDIENPPSLMALARTAGMSHPKLNRLFRQRYGMTVFQCLREERLRRARDMLEGRGLTVTETAFSIGYDSVSHFSQAYKKRFGVSPGKKIGIEGGEPKSTTVTNQRRGSQTFRA